MEEKQVFKTLPCTLNDAELINKVNEVSALQHDYESSWENKKRFENEAKKLKKDIEDLMLQISTKKEYREVECKWEYRWEIGFKVLFRLDTGEKLNSLPIEDYERQQMMPL